MVLVLSASPSGNQAKRSIRVNRTQYEFEAARS